MTKTMAEIHAAGGHAKHPRPRCPECNPRGKSKSPSRTQQIALLRMDAAGQPLVRRTGGFWCVADSAADVAAPRPWRKEEFSVSAQTVHAMESRIESCALITRVQRPGQRAAAFDDPREITAFGRELALANSRRAFDATDAANKVAPLWPRPAPLRPIVVRFADVPEPTFAGYTDGRLWNGFSCPYLPLNALCRVLALLVEWGDVRSFEIEEDGGVRVHGVAEAEGEREDYMLIARRVETIDRHRWLFDCGGTWTFVEVTSEAKLDADIKRGDE